VGLLHSAREPPLRNKRSGTPQSAASGLKPLAPPFSVRRSQRPSCGSYSHRWRFSTLLEQVNPTHFMREARNLADALRAITPGIPEGAATA
jgi:hypothetical protein